MALRYLLDTDVIIWHLRGHEPTEALLRTIEDEQPLGCSALSAFEIWAGARPQEEEPTRRFLETLNQIPADSRIAATAQVRGLVLVTYNRSHYPMEDISLYEPMPRA